MPRRQSETQPKSGYVFDIETVRNPELRKWLGTDEHIARLEGLPVEDLMRVAAKHDIALGNRKKQDAVYAKCVSHFEQLYSRAALTMYGAQICTIACKDVVLAEEDVQWVRSGKELAGRGHYTPPLVWSATEKHTEADIIRAFLRHIYDDGFEPAMLMGFNIRGGGPFRKGFDIPMLRARCAVLGLPWPCYLPSSLAEDRYHNSLFDICDVFADGSCDTWLRMCGLPAKTAAGSDVEDMTPAERSIYCANDVELERLLLGIVLPNQPPRISDLLLP